MPSLWERLYGLASMPPEQAQGQVRGLLSGVASGVADTVKVPGQMMTPNPYPPGSEEASFYDTQKSNKATEWAPEMATNTIGTGGIVGVPVKGAEAAFGSGILRPKRQPPLVGVLHGTGAPSEFEKLRLPPPEHDLGIHATVDPTATDIYTRAKHGGDPSKVDMMSGMRFDDPNAAHPRTKPFLGDFQASLKFPGDAVKWNNPGQVITTLEDSMRQGFVAPRGLLEDMYNISTPKTWQDQFVPMLKDRGYDSLLYPHMAEGGPKYNTFMGFSPDQFTPRFSPEGLKLIEQRGVVDPLKRDRDIVWNDKTNRDKIVTSPWKLPSGILKKPAEVESLVKDPKKNTAKWWDESAPPSKLKEVDKQYAEMNAEADAAYAASMAKIDANKGVLESLKKDLEEGKIGNGEYWKKYDEIMFPNAKTIPINAAKAKYTPTEVQEKMGNLNKISVNDMFKLINDANFDMTHAQKESVGNSLASMFNKGHINEAGFSKYHDILWGKKPQPHGPLGGQTNLDALTKLKGKNEPMTLEELDKFLENIKLNK